MIKSTVTLYELPWTLQHLDIREDWFVDREEGIIYPSELEGEAAAEEAFHLTNAPTDYLTESQQEMMKLLDFKGPSLSVGDVVKVESYPRDNKRLPAYYLCKSFGWEKFNKDTIQLIKHLSW